MDASTIKSSLSILQELPKSRFLSDQRIMRFAQVAASRLSSVTLVMENLYDAHNMSAIVRSAEGMGLDEIFVVEKTNAFRRSKGIVKGADRWIQIRKYEQLKSCLDGLKKRGFLLAAADVGPECQSIGELDISQPIAIVMGEEKPGLSQEAKSLCDQRITIPMHGFTQSFNVSVSAALILHRLTSRRRDFIQSKGDLSMQERQEHLERWLEISLPRFGNNSPTTSIDQTDESI